MFEVELPGEVGVGPPQGGWDVVNRVDAVTLIGQVGILEEPVLDEQLVRHLYSLRPRAGAACHDAHEGLLVVLGLRHLLLLGRVLQAEVGAGAACVDGAGHVGRVQLEGVAVEQPDPVPEVDLEEELHTLHDDHPVGDLPQVLHHSIALGLEPRAHDAARQRALIIQPHAAREGSDAVCEGDGAVLEKLLVGPLLKHTGGGGPDGPDDEVVGIARLHKLLQHAVIQLLTPDVVLPGVKQVLHPVRSQVLHGQLLHLGVVLLVHPVIGGGARGRLARAAGHVSHVAAEPGCHLKGRVPHDCELLRHQGAHHAGLLLAHDLAFLEGAEVPGHRLAVPVDHSMRNIHRTRVPFLVFHP
mmetsp:Transcript_37758/g.84181  ORF Transcript_37758/g.84181 Transcript_37758/m.84181 type:complete len:355 (-) Transcript_37758:347-1411(-)